VALGRIVLAKRERVMAVEPYERGLSGTLRRRAASASPRRASLPGTLWRLRTRPHVTPRSGHYATECRICCRAPRLQCPRPKRVRYGPIAAGWRRILVRSDFGIADEAAIHEIDHRLAQAIARVWRAGRLGGEPTHLRDLLNTALPRSETPAERVLEVHHDALEFPDGQIVLLTSLCQGQQATVLQLPVAPRTPEEAEEQNRVAVV
jgi:hypothetical protein